jgi:hypothetical protein
MGAFCLHGNLDTCEVCRRELETDDDYAPIPTTGFAHVLPRDWPTFWQSLTPAETAAALRAAPKVAEPWVRTGMHWSRKDMDGASRDDGDVASVVDQPDGSVCWITCDCDGKDGRTSDAETAKSAADAALVAAGWVLL